MMNGASRQLALCLAVQLRVRDAELFDHAAVDDRFFDDPRYVSEFHAAVPNRLGVDHDGWAELALIEAAGRVGSDQGLESALFNLLFERLLQGLATVGI